MKREKFYTIARRNLECEAIGMPQNLLMIVMLGVCVTIGTSGCQNPVPRSTPASDASPGTNLTQVVCRVVELCWYRDATHTTGVYNVKDNGTYIGESYDIWKAAPGRTFIGSYTGTVPIRIIGELSESLHKDPRWRLADGIPTYAYGMMDYGKFNHPKPVGEFLSIALNSPMFPTSPSK